MRHIWNLNHKWAFSKEAKKIPEVMPTNWHWVNLPHTWNAIDGQDGGNDYYRGVCYYAKQFYRTEMPEGACYYLEINGANSSADVYVNGKFAGHHDGGYSTWRVDVTPYLQENNLLVIAVDNRENENVYPQMADFTFYGGLYRDVNLIAVSRWHFDLEKHGSSGIFVTPKLEGEKAKVRIDVGGVQKNAGQKLRYRIYDAEGKVLKEVIENADITAVTLDLSHPHLWMGRKDAYLYLAEVTLLEKNVEIDRITAHFGCRSYEIHPEKGFLLNGISYPLRGVARHQDWKGIGNALLPEHHRKDMELICEMGANTIRLAHYQHDSHFYDLCDEMGMIVWAEIPYISKHMEGGRENTLSQMKELILQNYNHPSIVVWGISNEITMAGESKDELLSNHRALNDLCHELDSTRKTAIAAVSMCDIHDAYLRIPDVVSYNHYFGWYGGEPSMNGPWLDEFHKVHPQIPLGMSEYGCEALDWHSSSPRQGDYTEEYQAYYHEELIKQLFTRSYLWATHVWNMFDFGADARSEGGENGQNHKGLVTFDRSYKKDAFYAYKAWLSDEPFVHICGKRYTDRVEDVTKITVYSNQPKVSLYANEVLLESQSTPEHFFYFEVPNQGETKLLAIAGDCADESIIRKVDIFPDKYRLKEKGAVLNWFDIQETEGAYCLNDKVSDILKNKEGEKLIMEFLTSASPKNPMFDFSKKDGMMQMIGGFTLLRLISTLGMTMRAPSKEELLELNRRLGEIKRVI